MAMRRALPDSVHDKGTHASLMIQTPRKIRQVRRGVVVKNLGPFTGAEDDAGVYLGGCSALVVRGRMKRHRTLVATTLTHGSFTS